ncbi:MAG: S-layer homology domain-containing protein, partial [Defluviitaleaceae bacterium]|nr:S-layer homology domain-containing protein [Defluviitaleaceae bacterium]
GTMGFSGGISEGLRMPTVTERLLDPSLNGRRDITGTFEYTEIIFISGNPSEVNGEITVGGGDITAADFGNFTRTLAVTAEDGENINLERAMSFSVDWRREANQVIKNYTASAWAELITATVGLDEDGEPITDTFTLDLDRSEFIISIIEDHNPGIIFYRGNISKRAVFEGPTGDYIKEVNGVIYGFSSPYSNTETQRLDTWVLAPNWQMSYQVRPSVSVTTSLLYNPTTPTPISFSGNYMHFMQNNSILAYDIFIPAAPFHNVDRSGSASIETRQTFEQLIAPDLSHLRGHFAERDISRLFAQQILTGQTTHFVPSQVMTRGEFISALVHALRIEVPTIQPLNAFNRTTRIVFPDITRERPEYPIIMAAYRAGIAHGRNDGNFHIDTAISREEVVAVLIRALGLENVSPNPTPVTVFTDSASISPWARREIAAAAELGIISGDTNGNFHPQRRITKAEASALINRFIDYMREDLVHDYSERMVNFVW